MFPRVCCVDTDHKHVGFLCEAPVPGSLTTPGRPNARDDAPRRVAFHDLHGVGTQNRKLSRLNGWPMRSPVNASLRPSRVTAHDSGPMWIATPSSQGGEWNGGRKAFRLRHDAFPRIGRGATLTPRVV